MSIIPSLTFLSVWTLSSLLSSLTLKESYFNQLPDNKILGRSNLEQSADDNFKFDKNSKKSSRWVENTMGKGEIAGYEQFLLFPPCFQKACFLGASKGVIVWNGLNYSVFL